MESSQRRSGYGQGRVSSVVPASVIAVVAVVAFLPRVSHAFVPDASDIAPSQQPQLLLAAQRWRRSSRFLPLPFINEMEDEHEGYAVNQNSSPVLKEFFERERERRYRVGRYEYEDDKIIHRPQRQTQQQQDDRNDPKVSNKREYPTDTMPEIIAQAVSPPKPKIVVMGAAGRVGSHIIRQLRETGVDMTIVALVRDLEMGTKVLCDDVVDAKVLSHHSKKGPKLQIVESNLVPPEELPGFTDTEFEEEESLWMERATSAAEYFHSNVSDYDNRGAMRDDYDDDDDDLILDANEALSDAIKDCTAIISCVGSVRPTNYWTDFIARPFSRLFNPDVSGWCPDRKHPYYTILRSTRKALGYAEREQLRREAAAIALAEAEGIIRSKKTNVDDDDDDCDDEDLDEHKDEEDALDRLQVPRIRFIRISDATVNQKPWALVPMVANAVMSMIYRYHEMADHLLEQSTIIETVVLRPGDMVDHERDIDTTSLQVTHTGKVPSPACVGREDVASLAIASVFFESVRKKKRKEDKPLHYSLGVRWVGDKLHPLPAQGRTSDGHPDVKVCMKRALAEIAKEERRNEQRNNLWQKSTAFFRQEPEKPSDYAFHNILSKYEGARPKKRRKPYAVCVAIPVYLIILILTRAVLEPFARFIPGQETIIRPALIQVKSIMWAVVSVLAERLKQALPSLVQGKRFITF